jgi:hypothetical protein
MTNLFIAEESKVVSYCEKFRAIAYNHYNTHHREKWEKYRALWECEFKETMRSRKSERSKLINPTTQVGVDTASSEMDAAVNVGSIVVDPVKPTNTDWDQYKDLWDEMQKKFKDDLVEYGSRAAISEMILNSAMLGIGYLKAVPESVEVRELSPQAGGGVSVSVTDKVLTKLVSVDPNKLWYDPSATSIPDAEYIVEETVVPRHSLLDRMEKGEYSTVPIPDNKEMGNGVKVMEYHGLIPRSILLKERIEESDGITFDEVLEVDETVEALVIWIDGTNEPLFAEETPYLDSEKSYSAFPWDMNPHCFVGRGVSAKAYNVQVAQDSGLRARTDALAYAVHPMIGVDSLKLVQRRRMKVSAGQQILTMGDPNKAIVPFRFADVPESAFIQSQDLARMANEATGLNAFGGVDPKFQSAAGMDALQAPNINRSRRTLESLTNCLMRAIKLLLWRSTQYDPENYPPVALDFKVSVVMGSLSRGMEQAQAAAMMKTLPESSSAYWKLLVNFFELGDMPDKEGIISDVKDLAERALNPPEPQPTVSEKIEIDKLEFNKQKEMASLQLQAGRVRAELVRAAANLERVDSQEVKDMANAILAIAKAESEEVGSQISQYQSVLSQMQEKAEGTENQFNEKLGVNNLIGGGDGGDNTGGDGGVQGGGEGQQDVVET